MPDKAVDVVARFYIEVGRRIRAARAEAALTQAELAARLGMTRSSIANLEAGRQRIPLHQFVVIATNLGAEPSHLLASELLQNEAQFMGGLARHLSQAPRTTRDFVESAIAQLDLNSDAEE